MKRQETMPDAILKRLRKIRKEFETILIAEGIIEKAVKKRPTDLGLTRSSLKAWQENEPDFTKRIATPLGTKRRGRVTLRKVTLTCQLIARRFSAC